MINFIIAFGFTACIAFYLASSLIAANKLLEKRYKINFAMIFIIFCPFVNTYHSYLFLKEQFTIQDIKEIIKNQFKLIKE